MSKSAIIHARTDPALKQKVESIFQQLGLNPTSAINMFYQQVNLHGGMPFSVNIKSKKVKKIEKE